MIYLAVKGLMTSLSIRKLYIGNRKNTPYYILTHLFSEHLHGGPPDTPTQSLPPRFGRGLCTADPPGVGKSPNDHPHLEQTDLRGSILARGVLQGGIGGLTPLAASALVLIRVPEAQIFPYCENMGPRDRV